MAELDRPAEGTLAFAHPDRSPGALSAAAAAELGAAAGDVVLMLDASGIVTDVAGGGRDLPDLRPLVGQPWIETVTIDSRAKVEEMLARRGERGNTWRQLNQMVGDEASIPVRYRVIGLGDRGAILVGRDLRAAAALQQRLLQVQQSLERDHLRLRQAESQYRMLFERSGEPLVVAEAASLRIREINRAAIKLIDGGSGAVGAPLTAVFAAGDRDRIVAFLGAVAAGARVASIDVTLATGKVVEVGSTAFRRDGSSFHLVWLGRGGAAAAATPDDRLAHLFERMPDAFVTTDGELAIESANPAFVELVHASGPEVLRGRPLAGFLGRPGIDLDLILGQLREHGTVRNVATILFSNDGGQEEVEVSAVRLDGKGGPAYGFCMRSVARRLRDLPPMSRDLPRSVEQLTDLVGRVPLKSIVRESTDLIERLCIEAALTYTADNRASAAEILGLSRQSLYSKLHRHGLGNLADSEDM